MGLWGLLQISAVQTYMAKKVASYFSNELNTKIEIDRLEIDFWNEVNLNQFYVEDKKGDTLLFLENLKVEIEALSYGDKFLAASLSLSEPVVNLYREKDQASFNYDFIEQYFTDTTSTNDSSRWEFDLKSLWLENGRFRFHDNHEVPYDYGVDYSHIEVSHLALEGSEFDFSSDTIGFQLIHLELKEHSGFKLDELAGYPQIYSGGVQIGNMHLKSNKTNLWADFSMIAESFGDYSDFYDKVKLRSDFNSSIVHISDLAYFVPDLKGINNYVYLDGEVKGTVDNLKGDKVEIIVNKETFLMGDFAMRGLPDFDNTFIFLELDEFRTSASGLRKLPYPPFESGRKIDIPKTYDHLGSISFKGNFTGYPTDFVAYGNFTTALGTVNTDLLMKADANEVFQYSGEVESEYFKLGELFEQKDLGAVGLSLKLEGEGLTKETAKVLAEGEVDFIEFKGYNYTHIDVNGNFDQEQFTGKLSIEDKNLISDFTGIINISEKKPISQFQLNVEKAKLSRLNLFNKADSSTTLSFESVVDLRGKDVDDFSGSAIVKHLIYKDKKLDHQVNNFKLIADKKDKVRKIELRSSFLDAKLEGDYRLKDIVSLYKNYQNNFFPESDYIVNKIDRQHFSFNSQFKNTKAITEVLLPELKIDSGMIINGEFDSENYFSDLTIKGGRIVYGQSVLKQFDIDLDSKGDSADVKFFAQSFSVNGSKSFKKLNINTILRDSLNTNFIYWEEFGNRIGNGEFRIENQIHTLQKMKFSFVDSYFLVNDSVWKIANENELVLDSGNVGISNLLIGNQQQNLRLDGRASASKEDTLKVELKDIDLAFVSSLLPDNTVDLLGTANGKASIIGVYDDLSLITNLNLDSLFINDVEIGRSSLKSIWDSEIQSLLVDGNLGDEHSDVLRLQGNVFPLKEENSLDLNLEFNHFPLELIKPYLVDYLADIEGNLNGNVKVNGVSNQPLLRGMLDLKQTHFHINYLNTDYRIDDKVVIEPDFIGFNLIKIVDSEGNHAIATGTVFHENYSDFNYDIGLEFENFLSLNTSAKDNSLYYGRGVTSGIANISGYSDQLIIELDVKTEKGTDFKIPLEEGVDISNSDFLIFTNSPDYNKEVEEKVDLSGIQLSFDLDITPEAKLQIIFDEQVGDIIKATGEGDLKLEINTIGDFNIYGQYLVEKGDYLFTLQNIINKRFEIANGSSMYWMEILMKQFWI